MPFKHRLGPVNGSVKSPQLSVLVWNEDRSDVDTAEAIEFAVGVAPVTILGNLQTLDPSFEELAGFAVRVTISYSAAELQPPTRPAPREIGTLARRHNFQAKSKFITRCLEPIGVYDDVGEITEGYDQIKWMVNVQGGGSEPLRVAGATIDPLPETRTTDYYAPNSEIDDDYFDLVESLMGSFCDATFQGRPQGSMQLVRFSASERSPNDWELSFGWGVQLPKMMQVDDDITLPEAIRGSWHVWNHEKEIYVPDTQILRLQTQYVVVQRVWEEADFSALNLPEAVYPEPTEEP